MFQKIHAASPGVGVVFCLSNGAEWTGLAVGCSVYCKDLCFFAQATFSEHDREERHRVKNSKHRFFEHPAPEKQALSLVLKSRAIQGSSVIVRDRYEQQTFSMRGFKPLFGNLRF